MVNEIPNLADIILPGNESLVAQSLPPELIASATTLITIFKAAGIIFIGYMIFLIVRAFFSIRTTRRIGKMYHKIDDIDEKLDKLLKRESKGKHEKKEKKK